MLSMHADRRSPSSRRGHLERWKRYGLASPFVLCQHVSIACMSTEGAHVSTIEHHRSKGVRIRNSAYMSTYSKVVVPLSLAEQRHQGVTP
jgi:hypothetical protein